MQYKSKQLILTILLTLFLVMKGSYASISELQDHPVSLIVVLGQENEALARAGYTLRMYVPFVDEWTVKSVAAFEKAVKGILTEDVLFVAHGTERGIQVGQTIVTWETVGVLLDQSKLNTGYFASCYSERLVPHTRKTIRGFAEEIDALVAGIDLSALLLDTHYPSQLSTLKTVHELQQSPIYTIRQETPQYPLVYTIYTAVLIDADPASLDNDDLYSHYFGLYGAQWRDAVIDDLNFYMDNFTDQFDAQLDIRYVDTFIREESDSTFDEYDVLDDLHAKRADLTAVNRYFDLVIGMTRIAETGGTYGIGVPDLDVWDIDWSDQAQYQDSLYFVYDPSEANITTKTLFSHEISHIFGGQHVDNNDDPTRWTVMDYADMEAMDRTTNGLYEPIAWDTTSSTQISSNISFYNGWDTTRDTTDLDGDGVQDWEEVDHYGTDPTFTNSDTDGDGLGDFAELDGWMVTVTTSSGSNSYWVTSSYQQADTDGDGVWDDDEQAWGCDPRNSDTDGDGVSDYDEIFWYQSDPTVNILDADNDGLDDQDELAGWDIYVVKPGGIHVTYHITSSPNSADTDADGVSDLNEWAWGSDPQKSDTDFDGYSDYSEWFAGTNPAHYRSKPSGAGVILSSSYIEPMEDFGMFWTTMYFNIYLEGTYTIQITWEIYDGWDYYAEGYAHTYPSTTYSIGSYSKWDVYELDRFPDTRGTVKVVWAIYDGSGGLKDSSSAYYVFNLNQW